MNTSPIILVDSNPFPEYDGEALCWSIGAYDTWNEAQKGYPKMRAVIHAMREHRPEQLNAERLDLLKSSFCRMFGHVAKNQLTIIEQETGTRKIKTIFDL